MWPPVRGQSSHGRTGKSTVPAPHSTGRHPGGDVSRGSSRAPAPEMSLHRSASQGSRRTQNPVARRRPPRSTSELSAMTGIADVRAPSASLPGGVRAVHVRQPEVHQDHVRKLLVGERDSIGRGCGFQRPETRRPAARRGRASGSSRCRRRSGRAEGDPAPSYPLTCADSVGAGRRPLPRPRRGAAPARDGARPRGRRRVQRPRLAARRGRRGAAGRRRHRYPHAAGQ